MPVIDGVNTHFLPGDNAATFLPVVYFNSYLTPDVTYCWLAFSLPVLPYTPKRTTKPEGAGMNNALGPIAHHLPVNLLVLLRHSFLKFPLTGLL